MHYKILTKSIIKILVVKKINHFVYLTIKKITGYKKYINREKKSLF